MFGRQNNAMKSNLPLSLKGKAYNQCILPVITCGSEIWRLAKSMERKLQSAQRGMERIIFGITLRDRKRVSWIREQEKVEDIFTTTKRKIVVRSSTCHAE